MPVVGFMSADDSESSPVIEPFRQGLRETGFIEGRNVGIEFRLSGLQYDRLPAMAADLVRRKVAVIVAVGATPVQVAAKAATTTIPIVFSTGSDPIKVGLVESLSRPGGNATGVTNLNAELMTKRLEFLHEMVPAARIVGALVNPNNSNSVALSRELAASASSLGVQLTILHASKEGDFDSVFLALRRAGAGALMILGDALFVYRSERLGALTLHHGVPAIFQFRPFAAAGGLMSYGTSNTADISRLVGIYTGRILKGEKPANLPVQQVSKVELIINFKTAAALGLSVPLTLRGRADEVIE
jgi:putative ABC transport system substrate-binding protein